MNCLYCGSRNDEDEHRCRRCGRRLHISHPRPAPEGYRSEAVLKAATAPAMAGEPARPALSDRPDSPPQGSLFGEREAAKVIPFRPSAREAARPPESATRSVTRSGKHREEERELPLLDFLPPARHVPRTLKTSVEAVIYCDAPVAIAMHRVVAAAMDFGMIVLGIGLFLTAYYVCGGGFPANRVALGGFAAAGILIAVFYGSLWAATGGETAGMRWAHLRLVNFDGFRPELRDRWKRFFFACLSFAAAGLGLLWALVDEESLTWHDHISKTFPTLEETQSSSFRRR
jgi:uncharacterized RDD family membrane protein YckC